MTAMLDSLRPADSARSAETTQHRRPTSKDILAGGYNCQREIPEPVECEFCGRKLYHEALVMGRTVLMFAPFPQRCTCDRAKAKWAEADAEEARQKAEAEKEAAQAKRRAKIERLLGRSGIKKRFQQRTFANFIRDTPERRRCYDTAKTYADSFPQRAERGVCRFCFKYITPLAVHGILPEQLFISLSSRIIPAAFFIIFPQHIICQFQLSQI